VTKTFSILVPVYNRQGLVGRTIDSVLAQTFSDYELIIIDDGSTDGTRAVLESYGTQIRTLYQTNQGPEVARNQGALLAEGKYLAFLDSDDILLPWGLATYNRIIQEFDFPALIAAAMVYFQDGQTKPLDASQDPLKVIKYSDFLAKDVAIGASCSMIVIKKSAFERAGGLRNSTPTTFHMDTFDMLLRFGTCEPCIVVKKPVTVGYCSHTTNTNRDVERMVKGALSVIRAERRGQYPGGSRRRFSRHAYIGGMAWSWFKYALRSHHYELALKLLICSAPMVMAGGLKKLWFCLHRTTPPHCLSDWQRSEENGARIRPAEVVHGDR